METGDAQRLASQLSWFVRHSLLFGHALGRERRSNGESQLKKYLTDPWLLQRSAPTANKAS
jgi:hypothetical protein